MTSRFWDRVDRSESCWVWTGTCTKAGYGQLNVGGRRIYAHRVSWELNNGPIPQGLLVCHHCDNPPCVRPDHLFVGTDADNMRDKAAKGRNYAPWRGVTHCIHGHEFTPENTRVYPATTGVGTRRICVQCCHDNRNRLRRAG